MATASRHLYRTVFHVSKCVPAKRKYQSFLQNRSAPCPSRFFSAIGTNRADDIANAPTSRPKSQKQSANTATLEQGDLDPSEYLTPANPLTTSDLDPEERADYEVLSKADQNRYLALQNHYRAVLDSAEGDEVLDKIASEVDRQIEREVEPLNFPMNRARGPQVGYWAEEEEDELGMMEDDDDSFSDEYITSVAESELDLHREIRQYNRIIAWDLPLLGGYAKPFQPPTSATPLRFRYTTYMGESHPAAKKVALEFCTRDLPGLNEQQRTKLVKLVGVRYNPDTDVVKMSCEKFEAPAQNKRYLGDLVNKLITEAQNPTDLFEDVALDFRHHKPKSRPVYPEEWKLRPEQVKALLTKRQEMPLLEEGQRAVDGKQMVESYVRASQMQNRKTLPA